MACSVCLEQLDFHSSTDIVGLPCTHVFHGRCVAVYYDCSGCPKCRHKAQDGAASFLELKFDVDDGNSASKSRDSFTADLLNALDQAHAANDGLVAATRANKTYQAFNVSKATFQVEFHDVESIGTKTLSSNVCYVRGVPWTLDIYREKRHKVWWLGTYISCELEPNWTCNAGGSIELVARSDDDEDDDHVEDNQTEGDDGEPASIKHNLGDHLFDHESDSWGTCLIRWDRACDPNEAFIKDDALLFNVKIIADAPTVTFRFVMGNFRSLRNGAKFSPIHTFHDVPWQICVEREKSDDGSLGLGFYLHCAINSAASVVLDWRPRSRQNPLSLTGPTCATVSAVIDPKVSSRWSCRARAKLRIVAQFDFAADIEEDIDFRFSWMSKTYGVSPFVAWGQICNAKVGHIKDDTVIFEVSLSADPAFGI